ncbi:hypothetical protein GCU67_03055 [Modestobacter muralis]|uniref:Uncharacterized protein n=1 Tax=Modestobacter muralis TaxID=1608614 RepID=A0A6P0EPZ7_9ACTN|nr:hypothetical protein [Modestobacter muralis]NEK93157.1 hypothetical protein [Modestobacter muralis]NEN49924.1 hypothetical protein [Modestobacter muralis]
MTSILRAMLVLLTASHRPGTGNDPAPMATDPTTLHEAARPLTPAGHRLGGVPGVTARAAA